jgi:hypothetical protein
MTTRNQHDGVVMTATLLVLVAAADTAATPDSREDTARQ